MQQYRTEKGASQQKLIGDSLMKLMETEEYSSISVSRLCQCAGIPRRTFYYYYSGKDEVLYFVLDQLLAACDLESVLYYDRNHQKLVQGLTSFFVFWRDHGAGELRTLQRSGLAQALIQRCRDWIKTEKQWQYLICDYSEEEQAIRILLGITCVFYALFYWCEKGFPQTPEYMADCVAGVMTQPLYDTL